MECEICDNKFGKNLIYENEKIRIMLAIAPAAPGHIQIFPKQHHTILEEVPDELLAYMSAAANKLSMLLFELLKVHGTNIIINNGLAAGQRIPHFSMHVIPRRTDDGLKLDWEMKKAADQELESIQRIIAEKMDKPDEPIKVDTMADEKTRIEQDAQIKHEVTGKVKEITDEPLGQHYAEKVDIKGDEPPKEKKTNYYLKNLERIP